MTASMTAFTRQSMDESWGNLTWELRSVNHRYLDINPRLPEELRSLEMPVREKITAKLSRGKVEAVLRFTPLRISEAGLDVDEAMAKAVLDACQVINKKMHQPSELDPMEILQWPGVVRESKTNMEPVKTAALALLDAALDDLSACRNREGAVLQKLILQRQQAMAVIVTEERGRRDEILEKQRQKLRTKIEELDVKVEPDRFEQELVYLLQKLDVDEELDRLETHLQELDTIFALDEPVGRRLDFLMQEFNREANTLGSKAADIRTTQASVELKVLIEQMREQIQNIE